MLKRDDIVRFFSRSAFSKAEAYQKQQRVFAVEITDDFKNVRSRVRGSASQVYSVDILLGLKGDAVTDVDGECSCPVGYDCKHVAATLLEVIARKGVMRDAASKGSRSGALNLKPVAQVLSPEVSTWLDKIGKAVRSDDYAADVSHRLFYALQPVALVQQMPHLAVSLLSVRLLKSGELSDTVSRPGLSGFDAYRAPKYYRAADIDIVARLLREPESYFFKDAYPIRHIELLQTILATGRAYWLDHKRSPLQWGEPREGRVEWRMAIRVRFDAAAIRYSLLTGKTKDRRAAIASFQGGSNDVFLISLKAGGVGLNLTAADTVIIFDPWWNPAVEEQAIDRAHRIGQDKAVFVYRLVAAGTIEEKMDALKAKKRALADGMFDKKGGVGSALTEEDVQALFEG